MYFECGFRLGLCLPAAHLSRYSDVLQMWKASHHEIPKRDSIACMVRLGLGLGNVLGLEGSSNSPLAYCLGPTCVNLQMLRSKLSPLGSTRRRNPERDLASSKACPNLSYLLKEGISVLGMRRVRRGFTKTSFILHMRCVVSIERVKM